MSSEKKQLQYEDYDITFEVTLEGIRFDTALASKLYKKQGKTFTDLWNVLTKAIEVDDEFLNTIINLVKGDMEKIFNESEPLTVQDILKIDNAEQRYYLFSKIDLGELEALSTVVDEQTVQKVQNKTFIKGHELGSKAKMVDSGAVDVRRVEYADTYSLLKVDKSVVNTPQDIFMVKCKDTSTNRIYYIYVNGEESEEIRTDAISAIASTMLNPDGTVFTREQYLELSAEA